VLFAILIGARIGGVGLGVMGGAGLVILAFGFHVEPTTPPIDVLFMILSVVTATSALQAAGGIDYMVGISERFLRSHPSRITYYGPLVTYFFTFLIGTGHIAYSLLPVIAEVARKTGIRPERPLSVSVIASQQAITASPISAATVALLSMLSPMGIELYHIALVSLPSTLIGVLCSAWVMNRWGKDIDIPVEPEGIVEIRETRAHSPKAKGATGLFLLTILCIVLCGALPSLRPHWNGESLKMATILEIFMLTGGAGILCFCRIEGERVSEQTIFRAGMTAVISIFGIAWLGDSFFSHHKEMLDALIHGSVSQYPWLFAFALFGFSTLLYSQSATLRALLPLGIHLGIPASTLLAMFPAVNGYFVLPNYPTLVAAVQFDTTGTTRIGKYVLNHSFMLPGLLSTLISVLVGFLLVPLVTP